MDVFSDGSSTLPASTKKERHDVSRVFLFWVPPPKGRLYLPAIKNARGSQMAGTYASGKGFSTALPPQ